MTDLHSSFGAGAIKRIYLKDFMVHTQLEINCSAQVNLIIGANGSGKSSVVCAICLGLGGDTGDMQREKSVSEFIRSGQQQSTIEITVQGSERSFEYKIQRVLIREANKSEWSINGETCTMKVVHKLMERLHIQMDNPCQFLPQELVSGFTALNPVDLLKHVMQAVDPRLLDEHKRLVKDNSQKSENAEQLTQLKKQLASLREKKLALAGDVAAFKDYELLKYKIEALDVQKLLCKAEEGLDLAEKKRKDAEFSKTNWAERQARLDALNDMKEKEERLVTAREVDLINAKAQRTKSMTESKQNTENIYTINNEIEELQSDLQDLEGTAQKTAEALNKHKEIVAQLESEEKALPPLPSPADFEASVAAHRAALDAYNEAQADFQQVKEEVLTAEDDLKAKVQAREALILSNAGRIREMEKERFSRQSIMARKWVEENKARFKHPVFGPLLVDMEADAKYRTQIEALLPNEIKFGFVVQSRDDGDVLKECPNYSEISIITIDAETASATLARPRILSNEQLEAMIKSKSLNLRWAIDVVKADKVVKAAIMTTVAATFLVTDDPELIEKVYAKNDFPPNLNIASAKNIIRFFASKFDQTQRFENTSSVMPARFLNIETSDDKIAAAKKDEDAARVKRDKLLVERRALEAEQNKRGLILQDALAKNKDLKDRKAARSKLVTKLKSARNSLHEQIDAMKGDENLQVQGRKKLVYLRERQKIRAAVVSRLEAASVRLHADSVAAMIASLELHSQRTLCNIAKNEHKEVLDRITKAGNDFAKVTKEVDKLEKEARETEKEYEKKKEDLMGKDPSFEEIFAHLPTKLMDVDASRYETIAQLSDTNVDKNAKSVFDKAAADEIECERRISELEKSLDERTQLLQNTILRLRGEILQRVSSLSTKFAKFMARIACKGNITFSGDEGDPKMWGIAVRVAFRGSNEPTQLSKTSHSGGECAVSTMLVLLAMQDVTSLPFRVVDEINQGMGVNFEKCVFVVLAELFEEQRTATALAAAANHHGDGGASFKLQNGKQLFIISPKLLPNLQHTQAMRTHVIFNGPDVKEGARIHRLFSSLCKLPVTLPQPRVVDELGRSIRVAAEAESKARAEAAAEKARLAPPKKAKVKKARRKRKNEDDDDGEEEDGDDDEVEDDEEDDEEEAPQKGGPKRRRLKKKTNEDGDDDDGEDE